MADPMDLRLDTADEYMHELTDEPTFNESMYFNVVDPSQEVGAFFRLGNRANEGKGEMTTCVYLPDGRVAFMFQRPEVHTNDAFDAAGMRFEVVQPFVELKVSYDGPVIILDEPLLMAHPRRAFTESPSTEAHVALTYRAASPPFGGEPTKTRERPGEEFARGHYEQLVGAKGEITVGDEHFEVDGWGLRDHSWGPRTWQAPWYYRWLVGCGGQDVGFMVSRIARRESEGVRAGFVWDGNTVHIARHCTVATTWEGADSYHRAVHATMSTYQLGQGSEGDREWELNGEVRNLIPLRNRRDGLVTRISEGLTDWTLTPAGGESRKAWGLSEYLDQIVDGQPVGVEE